MSSFAYGVLTRKRQEASPGQTVTDQSGLSNYVDALAALVPAEVLAAHAVILSFTTSKSQMVKHGAGAAVQHGALVSEPTALKVAFGVLIALSVVFYAAGFQKKNVSWKAFVGGFVPPLAFVTWTMLQRTTAFDAIAPGMNFALRQVIGITAALVLPLAAGLLSVKLDKSASSESPAP